MLIAAGANVNAKDKNGLFVGEVQETAYQIGRGNVTVVSGEELESATWISVSSRFP